MPFTHVFAVCFTECPWTSLVEHAKKYSPYGIGFKKDFIFNCGGSPALYVRRDLLSKDNWLDCLDKELHYLLTPFWPIYASKKGAKGKLPPQYKVYDYTHEREWRLPNDLCFSKDDIEFIVVDTYEDIEDIRNKISGLSYEKFLTIQSYLVTEKLWPVHKID